MIREIRIENYKSIEKLKLELGRVTVLIGENGSGKSNILEAIALASAAASDKLDNEFLATRGIRVTEPQFMRSAFDKENTLKTIRLFLNSSDENNFSCELENDNKPYSQWIDKFDYKKVFSSINLIPVENEKISINVMNFIDNSNIKNLVQYFQQATAISSLFKFIVYSPENSALNTFQKEGQIQPLGIKGEGLFRLLKFLNEDSQKKLDEIQENLQLIDWFENFEIPHNLSQLESQLSIKDRYLDSKMAYFDQRSSNEGFLFLLFYFTLFISEETPKFFAVDNIDASLNPKLCSHLIIKLVELSKKYDKQVIFTTHNPASLDGLNLDDDEQRLFVVSRDKLGRTKVRRILKPEPLEGQEPVRLSEAFLRGYLGGLPKNF